jgi:hypothetical protein
MSKTAQIDGPSKNPGEAQSADLGQPASANSSPAAGSTTRRNLLQIGAGLAAISSVPRGFSAPAIAAEPINVPKAPNIIVLMTDQERHYVHWPEGWAEKNLPSLQRDSSATASISSAPIRRLANARRRAG